jgi:hypothetical protein
LAHLFDLGDDAADGLVHKIDLCCVNGHALGFPLLLRRALPCGHARIAARERPLSRQSFQIESFF